MPDSRRIHRLLVGIRLLSQRRVDDQVNVAVGNHVYGRSAGLKRFFDHDDGQTHFLQSNGRAAGRIQGKTHAVQIPPNLHRRRFVEIVHRDQHAAAGRQMGSGRQLRLGKRMGKMSRVPHHLAGAAHLRTEPRICPWQFIERQHRLLHKKAIHLRRFGKAQFRQRLARLHLRGNFCHRHAGRLAHKGHGAAGAGIHLNHVHHVVFDGVLDVHQAAHAQRFAQLFSVIADDAQVVEADFVRRQHAGAVAGMDASFFDVLHNPGNDHAFAVGDSVYIHLKGVFDELVNQHRIPWRNQRRLLQKMQQRLIVVGNGHGAPAEDERRPYQHRVANPFHHCPRLGQRIGQPPLRVIDVQRLQQRAKPAAIFGQVNGFRRRAPNGNPGGV